MKNIEGWKHRSLTDLAQYINGYAFKPDDWEKEGLPIIRIEQLKNPASIYDYHSGIIPESNIIDDGDLIFSWSASLFLKFWSNGRALLNQHLFKVEAYQNVDKYFLKFFIEFYLPEITKASHGSTMQHITRKELDRFGALAPVDKKEQEKIADILSTIDLAITQTEAIIAKQQRIKTGLMQDLLTKGIDENGNIRSEETHKFKDSPLGRIPVEWEVKELRDVSLIIDPNPSHRYPPSSDLGVPIASTENFVGDNEWDLSFSEKVPFSVFEQQNQRCQFYENDVVFARKGRIGFARIYGNSTKVFSHTVVIFKPRDRDKVESSYILWIVRFRDFFNQIDKQMNSNSGVPTLGVGFLGAVPVRIPKLVEQIQICSILDTLECRIEQENKKLSKQKYKKTGLMQDLLTGKVRVTELLKDLAL